MKRASYDELMELIKTRRSCRSYSDKPVNDELVKKVIEAGLWSASAHGTQDPKIIRVKSQDFKRILSQKTSFLMTGKSFKIDPFYGAPEMLLVCASKSGFEFFDGSLVIGHMMDAAHSLGLGSCWVNTAQIECFSQASITKLIYERLGLENQIGVGYLALGWPSFSFETVIPRKENRVFEI